MITKLLSFLFVVTALFSAPLYAQGNQPPERLNVLIIGAHPDDPEKSGGTAALFVAQGHNVRLLSLTNGNAGHQQMGGGPLARRRYLETQCAGKAIGAEYVVLDIDDGKLVPDMATREEVIRQIRQFEADLVVTPRPNDYHPDHRNAGLVVRDAAYMVTVPNIVPLTPHLQKNPVFMYMSDGFTKPNPFEPDVVVAIDEVIEKKIDMYHCHESQVYEWLPYNAGYLDQVPKDSQSRREWLATRWKPRSSSVAERYRDLLIELYGKERGSKVQYAEGFELSEYGTQPSQEELLRYWFPFFD